MTRFTAALLLSLTILFPSAQALQDTPEAQVMVLGSFHFTGDDEGVIHSDIDDFLSDRRQSEISDVLDRLETFAPTKILVELPPVNEAAFNEKYQDYLAGDHTLSVNERQQIGMALAARMGLEQIYATDFRAGTDIAQAMSAAENAGQSDLISQLNAFIENIGSRISEIDSSDDTVRERLVFYNGPEFDAYHDAYLMLAQMGSDGEPAGARQMTFWWERNLHIYANSMRHVEPGDRVLIIYGAGHKHLLDYFFSNTHGITMVDPLGYLQ